MRRYLWAWSGLALATALSCGGEEFQAEGSGGGAAAGTGGAVGGGGAPSGGSGGAAGRASGGAAGNPSGGSAGTVAGGSGGSAATGGSGGVDASSGGTGGADASTDVSTDPGPPTCPAPSSPTQLAVANTNPEYPLVSGSALYYSTDLSIWSLPLGGGTATVLHTDVSPSNYEGLVVVTHNLIWADAGRGELRHLDLNNNAFSILATGQANIQTVASDGSYVYWAYSTGIRRRQSVIENLYNSPGAYAIAVSEGSVFWVTQAGAVMRGPSGGAAEGGSAVTLATQANPYGGNWAAVSIALDATHVYWSARIATSTAPDGGPPPDAVWRVPRNGGATEQVLVAPGAEGIALSPTCVYMGHRGANGNGRVYVRAKTLGSPILNLGGFYYPRGLAISGTSLLVADSLGNAIYRANL